MLLGCCHCDEIVVPSSSIPSSSTPSASSSGPPTVTVTGCDPPLGGCIGDTIPLTFGTNIVAGPGTQNVCFAAAYLGDFVMHLAALAGDCSPWESSVRAKNSAGCVDIPAKPMWVVGLSITGPGTQTRIICTASATIGGVFGTQATYVLVIGSSPVDCVNSFTLTRTSTNPTAWPFPATIPLYPL